MVCNVRRWPHHSVLLVTRTNADIHLHIHIHIHIRKDTKAGVHRVPQGTYTKREGARSQHRLLLGQPGGREVRCQTRGDPFAFPIRTAKLVRIVSVHALHVAYPNPKGARRRPDRGTLACCALGCKSTAPLDRLKRGRKIGTSASGWVTHKSPATPAFKGYRRKILFHFFPLFADLLCSGIPTALIWHISGALFWNQQPIHWILKSPPGPLPSHEKQSLTSPLMLDCLLMGHNGTALYCSCTVRSMWNRRRSWHFPQGRKGNPLVASPSPILGIPRQGR